jgi:hypothetical protein
MTAIPPPPSSSPDPDPQPPRVVIERFRETRPWTRIVSVVSLTWCSLAAVALLLLILAALTRRAPPAVAIVAAGGEIAVILRALPAIALYRYSRGMQEAIEWPSLAAVEAALRQHRTFWKLSAVLTLIVLLWDAFSITKTVVIPNYRAAFSRAKLRRSAADVHALGDAVERYAHDHHRYPPAKSVEELRRYLEPQYIARVPASDAWGVPLDYVTRCSDGWCYDFALISKGRDGLRDLIDQEQLFGNVPFPDESASGSTTAGSASNPLLARDELPDRDVVYGDGRMVRVPPGMERK